MASLLACGVEAVAVRRANEIDSIDALVLPGGESTTIAQLAEVFGIFELIKNKIESGLPVYGSCAGMILLADQILDAKAGQKSFGGLDITVRRNAFGRQVDSFESDIAFNDGSEELIRAVFMVSRKSKSSKSESHRGSTVHPNVCRVAVCRAAVCRAAARTIAPNEADAAAARTAASLAAAGPAMEIRRDLASAERTMATAGGANSKAVRTRA